MEFSHRTPKDHEDATYWAEYDLAYFALVIGAAVPLDYIADLSEQLKAAWVEAYNDIQKQRNSG